MTFGHEVAGTVEAVGAEVHHVEAGAFVAAETHIACGQCPTCRSGRMHICERLRILGVDTDGAFAEFVVVPAQNAWVVGEGIAPEVATIMEPFGNAVHAAFGTGGGEDLATNAVAVIGCGPIGLFAVGIARALGAWKVIAIEPNPYRRAMAGPMGADLVIDPKQTDPVAAVHEATNGSGAEVVLEMSGNATAIGQGTRMLARGGRMSLLGLPDGPVTLDLNDQVIFKEARLQGITGREMFRTWQQTTTLLSTGRVDVAPLDHAPVRAGEVRGGVRDDGLRPVRQGDPAAGRLRRRTGERKGRGRGHAPSRRAVPSRAVPRRARARPRGSAPPGCRG